MNERIRELAEQASKLSRQEHPELEKGVTLNDILGNTERKVYVVDDAATQKFAELIIKECGRVLESYDPDFDWATVELKKHFGIE